MRLTDSSVRSLPTPGKGQRTYWDETLVGFGCRVSQGGSRSFVIQFGVNRQLITIGKYHPDILPLAKARTEAKRLLAENVLGKHRPRSIKFDEAKEIFLNECKEKNRPSTHREYKRLLNKHFTFGDMQIGKISPADIGRKLDRIKKRVEKRYATVVIKRFFTWAWEQSYVEVSPAARFAVPKMSARSRVLSNDELKKLLKAVYDDARPYRSIVLLLILTGQRKTEIASLEWEWIKKKTIRLPEELTKNAREHLFPVGDMTVAALEHVTRFKDNPYVFPARRKRWKHKEATIFNSWTKPKIELDDDLGIPAWTLHDIRRTLRTRWAELGISREVAERYINHVSGVHAGIVAVYDRHSYMEEMKVAVAKWEVFLASLLKDKAS